MSNRIKLKIPSQNGEIIEKTGTIMEIAKSSEPWSEYILEDGTKIKTKQVVTRVVRLDETTPEGTPSYSVEAQPVMSVTPPNDN